MSSLFRDRIHRHDWILLRALIDDPTLGDVQHAVIAAVN